MNQQGALHCEVCNAQLPNFNSMKWHIQGKKHQNALQFWDRKKEAARLSIFVRNFPMGTTEQELWQYFAQFGRVTKVSIVPPKNIYAIIEFGDMKTVDYVLQQRNHRLNSQNLIVKAREVEVPGQPVTNKYQQGYQHFRGGNQLGVGPISRGRGGYGPGPGPGGARGYGRGHMGGGGYQGNYYGQGPMYDQGCYDEQGPGSSKKKKVSVEDQIDQYYHEELIEKLMKVKGVQNQLEWLCQNLQVTAEEAQTKFQLCEKLQTCLGKFFPGCTVNQFGSSVNGFGLSGCDMDIFLDLSTMHGKTWELEPIKLPFVRDFRFLKEKEWGPLIPADLDKMGMTDQCKLISRILMDHLEGILDVQVIPSSRCPLVRFKYSSSDVKCDLSVNNKLALQNTKLLYLFSVLNSRVRLLVYAIRYWGKMKGVAGNQKASTKLSNYALTLMVLNYLQNLDPPVLPTIEKLSQLHGTSARTKIEGWDCTFAMDWQIIPQSNNTQTAAELLSGFFSYWSAFNFVDNVLITRSATELPFTLFFEKDNMQDGRLRSFKASSMNMQDPFVLNHNITQNVNDKMRDKIVRELRIAAIKTSVWGNEGFSMTTPSGGGDLIHLLNNEVPDIILQEDQEKQENIMEKGRMPAREAGEYEFEIELKPTQMSNKLLKQLQKGENYRVEWCKKMCDFIIRVLKEILMLTVEDLPDCTEEIREKMKEEMAKKEAADKRNNEIKERRRLRRIEKRKELEEKLKREEEEMKKKMEEEAAAAAAAAEAEKQKAEAEKQKAKAEAEKTKAEGDAEGEGEAEAEEAEAEAAGGEPEVDTEMEEEPEAEAGTSDSSAEKAGEKRPRPVSIFDIKVEQPKKFKGNKRYELNLDDMIEDSDDGEEIIEYKPDEPELRYKRECEAEVNYQHFMRAWCMTWARRKKAKNYLVNEEGRTEENIPMEKLISNAIWQNDRAPLPHPVVGFYCYMQSVIEGNSTIVRVEMDCKEGYRDFNTFFQFSKMYLYKMIDKYFN